MEQTSFPVEYDFKRAKLDLIDKDTGTIKNKYKCLPLMITLPLSNPLNPIGPPNQPDPVFKQTTVKSTTSTNGWIDFIPIENKQPNIITIEPNILFINKFSYNYDITVDIINKGNDDVDLRFMAQNPFSLLASNMNDINLDETSFIDIHNGQQIKFTITGEYQFFYINYPTSNFDINITIAKSNIKTPIFICNKKCENCTCFDIKGNGYIKIKYKGEFIYVPVYTTRIIGNSITKYLYPEFGYLRDLFYNITLANSLTPPSMVLKKISSPNSIIKILTTTVIKCMIVDVAEPCFNLLWGSYELRTGDLVELIRSEEDCPFNQIKERKARSTYRYSWNNTGVLATSSSLDQNVSFVVYIQYNNEWRIFKEFLLNKTLVGTSNNYSLPSGSYDSLSEYQWIAFGLITTSDAATLTIPGNMFDITITEI